MNKIFLTCQCGMLVGCFAKGQTNSFCDECENATQLMCAFALDEADNVQKIVFAENCEYCQTVVMSNSEESPAFLST